MKKLKLGLYVFKGIDIEELVTIVSVSGKQYTRVNRMSLITTMYTCTMIRQNGTVLENFNVFENELEKVFLQ